MANETQSGGSQIVQNHTTTERVLRVGRIGNARYLPIGRAIPFLIKGDKVLLQLTVYYDLASKLIAWTAILTAVSKEPVVQIKKHKSKQR